MGANTEELLDVYQKQVRSMMELAVPVWEPNLTVAESMQIERVQKAAFSIILGDEYFSYNQALSTLAVDTLSSRRQKLSLNFAKKSYKHPKYQTWSDQTMGMHQIQGLTKLYLNLYTPVLTSIMILRSLILQEY